MHVHKRVESIHLTLAEVQRRAEAQLSSITAWFTRAQATYQVLLLPWSETVPV